MAPSLEQVMQGLESRLASIPGLRVDDVVPAQLNGPQAFVGCPDIPTYRIVMGRAKYQLDFTITVLVSSSWNRTGQLALAGFANPTGATSVITAIEGDVTLGGIVDTTQVLAFRKLGMETVGAIGYFGGEFDVQVISPGN